jgi:hypothetical protein
MNRFLDVMNGNISETNWERGARKQRKWKTNEIMDDSEMRRREEPGKHGDGEASERGTARCTEDKAPKSLTN